MAWGVSRMKCSMTREKNPLDTDERGNNRHLVTDDQSNRRLAESIMNYVVTQKWPRVQGKGQQGLTKAWSRRQKA